MRAGQRLELLESHVLYPLAEGIVRRLHQDGHLTVLAGGSVRDSLLGVKPKDLDIATSAPPEVVEKAFAKTLAVGKAFGTIVVIEDGHNFEVTTFRKDGPYDDGRHPTHVTFTDAREDARRRDFTVNALFYDPLERVVIDYVGGIEDLHLRILRAVGVASERFKEDRLRMLRAVRFVGQLGFALEAGALEAIQSQFSELAAVSVERIFNESKRLLHSDHLVMGLEVLLKSKLYQVFWPEIGGLQTADLKNHPSFLNWENAFAAISILTKPDKNEERLRAWKSGKDGLRRVEMQIKGLRVLQDLKSTRADRARVLGSEVFGEVLVLAQMFMPEDRVEEIVSEFLLVSDKQGELPKAFVSGEDLVFLGVAPGAEMGVLLKDAFEQQLEGRVTSKSAALSYIKQKIKV